MGISGLVLLVGLISPELVAELQAQNVPFVIAGGYLQPYDVDVVMADVGGNHQSRYSLHLETPITTQALHIELEHPMPNVPATLFAIRCYSSCR